MARKLTDNQINYARNRAKGLGKQESAKEAYKTTNNNTASVMAWSNERNIKVLGLIEEERLKIYGKKQITEDEIIFGLQEIATKGNIEANRVRAYELLGKKFSLWRDISVSEGGIPREIIINYGSNNTQPIDTSKDTTIPST